MNVDPAPSNASDPDFFVDYRTGDVWLFNSKEGTTTTTYNVRIKTIYEEHDKEMEIDVAYQSAITGLSYQKSIVQVKYEVVIVFPCFNSYWPFQCRLKCNEMLQKK